MYHIDTVVTCLPAQYIPKHNDYEHPSTELVPSVSASGLVRGGFTSVAQSGT